MPDDMPRDDVAATDSPANTSDQSGSDKPRRKRRRRGRRGGRGGQSSEGQSNTQRDGQPAEAESSSDSEPRDDASSDDSRSNSRDNNRRSRGGGRNRGRGRGRGGDRNRDDAPDSDRDSDSHSDRDPSDDSGREEEAPRRERKPRAPGAGGNDVFADVTFEDLGLRNSVMKAVRELGFEKATFIQAGIIPAVLQGRDVLGQAKTGSGKTAAFGLPLFHLATRQLPCQSIVLCPTRELCIQIARDLSNFGKYTPIRVVAVYGGQPIQTQARKLEEGPEIVVATPGRLMDLMERRIIHLNNVRFAVLDEVDRMLDIGFRDDIRKILKTIKTDHQTVFVSATISPEIENLARTYMKEDVEKIVTTAGALTVEMVEQHYLTVNRWDKKRLLLHLLTHEEPDLTVVFCRTKRMVDDLTDYLSRKKIDAHAIHGDMHQGRRNKVMERLRHGQLSVVVASDLAARGLDVDDISHVVNYDLPEDPEIYIHRIGRTARAGRNGVAWSLVTPEEGPLLTAIEKLANVEIPHMDYPDFEPSQPPDGVRQRMEADQKSKSAPAKSRYAAADLPAAPVANAPKNDPRFPGGIVPSKLPPRKMQGKVSTGRGAKAAAALPPTDPKPEE